MFRIGGEEAEPCEFVDCSILKQAKLRIGNAFARNDLDVHLNTLAGILHLLIGFGLIFRFRLHCGEQAHFSHDPEQAFRAASISSLSQAVPQFDHSEVWVPSAKITDEL